MSAVVYLLVCLALPWLWGAIVAAAYGRRDRRNTGTPDPPAPDYNI